MRPSHLSPNDFPTMRLVRGFDGGSVHVAVLDGRHYVIENHSAMNDLLAPEDRDNAPAVRVYEFDTEDELRDYLRRCGWLPARGAGG